MEELFQEEASDLMKFPNNSTYHFTRESVYQLFTKDDVALILDVILK